MAIIKRSLKRIEANPPRINRKVMKAASEADIRRHAREDGDDPKAAMPDYSLNLVLVARSKLAMTQIEMAALTKIPVSTLRNWEQGRTRPDAAASALFKLLARNPVESVKTLKRVF
jgi:putative transcriptional regulator